MRRLVRLLGTLLILAGLGTLAWAGLVWQWQDPFTAVYTHYEQNRLSSQYDERFSSFQPPPPAAAPARRRAGRPPTLASERRSLARQARAYRLASGRGEALGRLRIPRMGLNIVIVNGTDHETLKRGPGRDLRTAMPGEGQLVYVAGHRTTYLAPFSHIDALRRGDRVTVELPYATFVYAVTGHRIVVDSNLAALKSRGHEELALQACYPRFFATHRYIAYARPIRVIPRGRAPLSFSQQALAASPG